MQSVIRGLAAHLCQFERPVQPSIITPFHCASSPTARELCVRSSSTMTVGHVPSPLPSQWPPVYLPSSNPNRILVPRAGVAFPRDAVLELHRGPCQCASGCGCVTCEQQNLQSMNKLECIRSICRATSSIIRFLLSLALESATCSPQPVGWTALPSTSS
jgi:hypothetical protein